VDGGPNRRNKAAFSNFSGVGWTLPKAWVKRRTSQESNLMQWRNSFCFGSFASWIRFMRSSSIAHELVIINPFVRKWSEFT